MHGAWTADFAVFQRPQHTRTHPSCCGSGGIPPSTGCSGPAQGPEHESNSGSVRRQPAQHDRCKQQHPQQLTGAHAVATHAAAAAAARTAAALSAPRALRMDTTLEQGPSSSCRMAGFREMLNLRLSNSKRQRGEAQSGGRLQRLPAARWWPSQPLSTSRARKQHPSLTHRSPPGPLPFTVLRAVSRAWQAQFREAAGCSDSGTRAACSRMRSCRLDRSLPLHQPAWRLHNIHVLHKATGHKKPALPHPGLPVRTWMVSSQSGSSVLSRLAALSSWRSMLLDRMDTCTDTGVQVAFDTSGQDGCASSWGSLSAVVPLASLVPLRRLL